ncbi:MAG: hypothetical protein MUF22_04060, partial [Chitinispirillaceae bacterium]|nr:hypothetical protein [Chitinispirillaceae bacterium]
NVINKAGAGTSQKATIKMPSLNGKVAVYGENRSVTVSNSAITDTFTNKNPVHIYVLPRVTSVVSALPKSNRKNALQMIVGRRGVPVRINLTSDDTKTVAIISSSGSAISTVRSENGIAHWDGVAAPGVYFAYVKGLAEVAKILLRD